MQGVGVTSVMVAVQFAEVGVNTMIKSANTNGMSNFVYVVYSNFLALCILVPSSLLYHRKKAAPPLTVSIVCRMFLVGFFASSAQTLMYTGIGYSSPTLSCSQVDLIPAFTFLIAVVSRMENLNPKLKGSQAKMVGTVVSITGALIVTLYKGLPLTGAYQLHETLRSPKSNWLLGGLLLAVASLGNSFVLVIQTWIIKEYPTELVVTTISCGFAVIVSTIIAVIAEKNPKAWSLHLDMELLAIIFCAIFVVSIRSVVQTWACRKKGPLYVAMFNPLGMVIAVGMGFIFLGDALYLGSIIGAGVIAVGFYAVLWGKAQEEKMLDEKNGMGSLHSSSSSTPLLQNKNIDV
uniref:WAT1-related protein n=1 Tax=Copaifera officinalis TaxID=327148 RepID=H2D7G7_9FABA|nr:auxin-induced nodulin [Copaifera officinalis]